MPRKGFSPYAAVYTRASTADADRRFFPMTGSRDGATVKSVHCQADVWNMTADVKVEFAFQESDDPDSWPAASQFTQIGTKAITADGIDGSTGYDTASVSKAYCRFGVIVRNNSAAQPKYEHAWVAARFDVRSC